MNEVVIFYLSTNPQAERALHRYFQGIAGYRLQAYEWQDLEDCTHFLLLEPFLVDQKYFSVSKIWKRFFYRNYPTMRLMIAGYVKSEHPAYLRLLDLPKDFPAWVAKLPPVRDFPVVSTQSFVHQELKMDKVIDQWDESLPFYQGEDIEGRLQRFFNGHADDGVTKQLTDLRNTMVVAYEELEKRKEMPYEEVHRELIEKFGKKEWELLCDRWKYYRTILEMLPFQSSLEEADRILNALKPVLNKLTDRSEGDFLASQCNRQLDQVWEILHQKVELYSRVELMHGLQP